MGVDMTLTQAVGVILDTDGLRAWQERVDPEGNLWGEEYIYELFEKHTYAGIEFGTAGSYYTSGEENRFYLYIPRISKSFSDYEVPGGIMGIDNLTPKEAVGDITADEAVRVYNLAQAMGTVEPIVQRFTAVLWH